MSEAHIIGSLLLFADLEKADIVAGLALIASVDQADMIGGLMVTARNSFAACSRRIWRAIDSPFMYPGSSLSSLVGKLQVLARCAASQRSLRSWLAKADDPVYAQMIERHPLLPALGKRPYLNSLWSNAEKVRILETHYTMVKQVRLLAFPHDSSTQLADLDHVEPCLTLELDKPMWFADEGEVAINLFSGGERIYSLLFTLGEIDGKRIAYVGAVQGRSLPDAVERYKRLTREAHGMRPRDLLFAAFRMLCCELAVERILAVSDRANVAHSGYFKNFQDVFVSHDDTWAAYGGVATPDGGFFDIASTLNFKDLNDIPSRKRAQYRRRYEMLESIRPQVAKNARSCRWTKIVAIGPEPPPRVNSPRGPQ